jgi:hypothetical protein
VGTFVVVLGVSILCVRAAIALRQAVRSAPLESPDAGSQTSIATSSAPLVR